MQVELYDLKADISEIHDISGSMPEKCKELKELLHQWREGLDARMPGPNPIYEEQ